MMALHHRKILFAEAARAPELEKRFSSDCYICYICPKTCFISSQPSQSPPSDNPEKNHVSTVVILMLCVLGVSFLVLSYLTIARYRFRNSRRRDPGFLENSRADFIDENHGPVLDHPVWYIRTVGLPQSVIDSIALFLYKKGDGVIDGHDCSVCLNDFQENESLRLLPRCSHAFHVGCIDTWLRSHKTCPVCRAPVLIENSNNARWSRAESSLSSNESVGENPGENELENPGEIESGESTGATLIQEDRTAKISTESKRIRVVSDLGDHCRDQYQELQAVRRSVSMDFSPQKGPVSTKRSFSFSGKRSLRKISRSLESIQIPENIN